MEFSPVMRLLLVGSNIKYLNSFDDHNITKKKQSNQVISFARLNVRRTILLSLRGIQESDDTLSLWNKVSTL